MDTSGRRQWTTPELVVLVRNRPEEAVLAGCKTMSGGGPYSQKDQCLGTKPGNCAPSCSSVASS